jgi:hypothetical protein
VSTSIPLSESVYVTLDSSGNGTVTIGPTNPYQKWNVSAVNVNVDKQTDTPQFQLYQGNGPNVNGLGGTYNGNQNSTSVDVVLYPGQKLCGVWTGGTPGAIATMTLNGTMEVP